MSITSTINIMRREQESDDRKISRPLPDAAQPSRPARGPSYLRHSPIKRAREDVALVTSEQSPQRAEHWPLWSWLSVLFCYHSNLAALLHRKHVLV